MPLLGGFLGQEHQIRGPCPIVSPQSLEAARFCSCLRINHEKAVYGTISMIYDLWYFQPLNRSKKWCMCICVKSRIGVIGVKNSSRCCPGGRASRRVCFRASRRATSQCQTQSKHVMHLHAMISLYGGLKKESCILHLHWMSLRSTLSMKLNR